MKNFLLGGIVTLILLWLAVGICEVRVWRISETQDQCEQEKPLKEYKIGWNKSLCFSYVIVDGHQYLMYINGHSGGIAHSPKCQCAATNLIVETEK